MLRDFPDDKQQYFIDGGRQYISRMAGVIASNAPEIDPAVAAYVMGDMQSMLLMALRESDRRKKLKQ